MRLVAADLYAEEALDEATVQGLKEPGKAMGYLHNQWEALVRFCDDGRYGIGTNPAMIAPGGTLGTMSLELTIRYTGVLRQRKHS